MTSRDMATRFFIKSKTQYMAVGTAQRMPDGKWRLTTWRPDGPSGHGCYNDRDFEREIRYHWQECPTAGLLLDQWSKTPEWERGLKQCQFVSAWNELSYLNRYDLARDLSRCPSLDIALHFIPYLLAKARNPRSAPHPQHNPNSPAFRPESAQEPARSPWALPLPQNGKTKGTPAL